VNPADQKFALVVPTLNEVANIKVLLDRAVTALSSSPIPWEILVAISRFFEFLPAEEQQAFAEFVTQQVQ
jgi:hypothetical protein